MALAAAASVVAAAGWCESQGWPFLGRPAQAWLAARLQRPVQLVDADGQGFALHLWGPVRLTLARLSVGNPPGFAAGPLLQADAVQLSLRWRDALRWRPGRSLPLQTLAASRVDLQLQRLPDGGVNWALGPPAQPADQQAPPPKPADVLTVQRLALAQGRIRLNDAVQALQLDASFSQRQADAQSAGELTGTGTGSFGGKPLRASLRTGSPSGWLADGQSLDKAVPLTLSLQVGRASLGFSGEVSRLLNSPDLRGSYAIAGPSLAALGEPVGITLPQTQRVELTGRIVRQAARWYTVIDLATVGSSRLGGEFVFERSAGRLPLLAGRLTGAVLMLRDLGPAVGGASGTEAKTVQASGRILPDRPFSLPSLRAMNADVLVALNRLDFGSARMQPAAPVRGRIRLENGVLAVDDLQATLAQGRLSGHVRLDGRDSPARWDVDLSGRDLLIEQWLLPVRRQGRQAWASGRLDARVNLDGKGHSTAELLASANGRMRVHWRQGQVSQLLVEAAGLDLAQGLGLLLVGDRPLTVNCAAADLLVKDGRATPQVMLVDTSDSLLWLDGSLSLATERLQLQAHVRPKDWSPLSMRTPLHIEGTLGAPVLSLDKPRLLQRALPAALLALLNPLAALLPLMDTGAREGPSAGSCQALIRRYAKAGLDAQRR